MEEGFASNYAANTRAKRGARELGMYMDIAMVMAGHLLLIAAKQRGIR